METRNCQKCEHDFVIEIEDKNFYEMMKVPAPTFCPECRFQRRLSFRNDRTLYKRTCEICKKEVISVYRPGGGVKIACQKCWWSDDFNPLKFGRDYDFSKSFFEQYKDLLKEVPLIANFVVDESRMINSPYNNMVLDLRNCYMMFDSDFNEDSAYGSEVENSRTCFDTTSIKKSEMCYECVNMTNCYRAFYSIDCENSNDIKFCRDVNGCTDCFGSVNLRNKSYYIFNEPMGSKEAYEAKLKEFDLSSRESIEKIKKQASEIWEKGITKFMHEKQNSDVTGDYIYNSKNVKESWIVYEGWNLKYCQYLVAPNVKDSYDFTQFGNNSERYYEVFQGGNGGSNIRFSWWPVNENREIDYSMHVMTSHDLFGCVGLRGKAYCILNKQYTKEEYEVLRGKIIEQMKDMPYIDKQGIKYSYGEFFPSELSPFAYNETTANEVFPLAQDEAIKNGFVWHDRGERTYKSTVKSEDIPDDSSGIPESITSEILECANSKKGLDNCTTAFRVITDEVSFYKRFGLPLPDKCPNCRHKERLQFRTLPRFKTVNCANGCGKKMFTAYDVSTPNLFCKECYLKAVI
ncbi:MAG TPA: hypothetical protein VGO63_03695 [Candidatus Paceibacterota bacterium]|jgi:hypothetical protein|nr:hypothetical protein [Candidatus Paceibacterota bacterium]